MSMSVFLIGREILSLGWGGMRYLVKPS
jgi:hypothetical protein